MRICILGNISGNLDEGMKNTTYSLYHELSKSNKIMVINPRKAVLPSGLLRLKIFNPDILHYIHGSSFRSFLVTKYLASVFRKSKSIVLITHPQFSKWEFSAIGFLKPDLVLVQSCSMETFFNQKGFRTDWLHSGVDIEKFVPVLMEKRIELRKRYGFQEDKFTVLHVGHIKQNRSLEFLIPIQQQFGVQVVIAGSTEFQADEEITRRLIGAGCIVWSKYFSNVEELYQLADCYVFPVMTSDGAIQIPLTVLEAAACNIPVVTTPFGGLKDVIGQRDGLFYVETSEEMIEAVEKCRHFKTETRKWAVEYSWEKIAVKLSQIYENL